MIRLVIAMIALAVLTLACMGTAATAPAIIAPAGADTFMETETVPKNDKDRAVVFVETAPMATICGNWNIRNSASGAGPSVGWLYDGDSVTIVEERNGWAYVVLVDKKNNIFGWVNGGALCAKH